MQGRVAAEDSAVSVCAVTVAAAEAALDSTRQPADEEKAPAPAGLRARAPAREPHEDLSRLCVCALATVGVPTRRSGDQGSRQVVRLAL